MLFMTIPTAGQRTALLEALIHDCGLPRDRVILIATRPNLDVPEGTVVVEDLEPPNIQRWWMRGINEAERRGATHVAVVNDDIQLGSETLVRLSQALEFTGAAVASPSRPPFRDGLHKRPLVPYEPRLWGSLWVLRLASGLRPDPRYAWWYGDNDIDIRARKDHGGVVLVPVEFDHLHPGQGTSQSTELRVLSDRDAHTFQTQYAGLLRATRLIRRWQAIFSLESKS